MAFFLNMKTNKNKSKAAQASKSAMNDNVRFNLLDEDGKVFESGGMPAELYDRACLAAEDQGTTVTALFQSAIEKAADKLPA
jgi:hypothetical protein